MALAFSSNPLALLALVGFLGALGGLLVFALQQALARLPGRARELWHDHRRQSDALVRTGDLRRPSVELPQDRMPPELAEALARHIEGSIPP